MCSNYLLQSRGLNRSHWKVLLPGAAGFTKSGRQMARQQSRQLQSTLLLPCHYFFQSSSVLSSQKPVSHLDLLSEGLFRAAPLFLRIPFCNNIALFFFFFSIFTELTACPVSLASHAQSPVLWFVDEVYFCHKRSKTKRERINACRLDAVFAFQGE